ncbi:ABC transporter ATP-binding protein [Nocardioides humi]|uniref:ABC transporter ATP-binding protein n=1 Tax=Nocardioides humi TaxID=449461 RepID=UPI0031CDBC0E
MSDDRVVDALVDIDLAIGAGEFVSLVGPSGCGKTTLLNMVAGLVTPTEGQVRIGGKVVTEPSRDTAYMLARDALFPWRSALENVMLGLEVRGVPRAERRAVAQEWMQRVHLGGFERARVTELSQGMRQRVAIARTLAGSPRCILMDEPFAALDAQTRLLIQQEFLGLWARSGATVVFVTHDLQEAVALSDRVVLMGSRPGRIAKEVDIDLPRPRNMTEIQADPEWQRVYLELQDALKEETAAMRAEREEATA